MISDNEKESPLAFTDVKGTVSYLPDEELIREGIVEVFRRNFKLYGFNPVETPILDFYEVGANKYGGGAEILKETYRLRDNGGRELILRYELTFKLAKLLAMNPNTKLPFKRYEIGKAFRDGPLKLGRFREFTQMDVDTIGSKDMFAEAELIDMTAKAFKELDLDVYIELNSRKLLYGLFESVNLCEESFVDAALSLDKYKKIGAEEVIEELLKKEISKDCINSMFGTLNKATEFESEEQKIRFIADSAKTPLALEGAKELEQILEYCKSNANHIVVKINPTLSRGLSYYTGPMWEVFLTNSMINCSIAAGGRWDNMITKFIESDKEYPAVGAAFGLDTIYEAVKEKRANKVEIKFFCESSPKVLVLPVKQTPILVNAVTTLVSKLRKAGISSDLIVDQKLRKSMEYANKNAIPYSIILGENELSRNAVTFRDMKSGEEIEIPENELVNKIKSKIAT